MPSRIIINGAHGKMGRTTSEALANHPHLKLVATLGRNDHLEEEIKRTKANIVIDFTQADCVYENCLTIINNNVHPIIGATGLLPAQIQHLTDLCAEKKLGGLIAPNFSIAAVLMMQFAQKAAKFLPYVEIVEAHHPQKLDAPSGTALKTAEMIANSREGTSLPESNELIKGARGALHCGVPIHSMRLAGVLAHQEVILGQLGETLSITHHNIDRIAYMKGVLLACERVDQLTGLYYGLEHILTEIS